MTNNYNVLPIAGSDGNLVQRNPNKADYGSIRMDQRSFVLRGGFLNAKNKVSFLAGKFDDLQEFVEATGLQAGKEMPGKLYTVESYQPFYDDQQPKINPTTGNAVLVAGALVYQQTFYDRTGTQEDQLITGATTVGPFIGKKEVVATESLSLSNG